MLAASEKTERVYYMDLARATILLTGVFFHCALLYQDNENLLHLTWFPQLLSSFLTFTRSFRMEALFVVSGFFSAVLVTNRGSRGFVRNRMVRMGVPLFFCGLIFNPFPYMFLTPSMIPWMHADFFIDGRWVDHLWNIANLLVYEGSMFACLYLWPGFHGWLARVKINPWTALVAYIGLWIAVTSAWSLLPGFRGATAIVNPSALPTYTPAYLLGYVVHQNKELRNQLFDWKRAFGLVVVLFLFRRALVSRLGIEPDHLPKYVIWIDMVQHIARATLLFAIVRAFETRNIWVKRISIASYTIYILHLPLQVLMLTFFPAFRQGYLAFAMLGLIPILAVWAFHVQVVERWKWAGFLFNGKIYDQKTRSF